MFVEQLLDYSYEEECIWASVTLYSVPQGICCEYVFRNESRAFKIKPTSAHDSK